MKTYKLLKELLFQLSEAQMKMIDNFLHEMEDNEFRDIPVLLMSEETKKVITTYGCVFNVLRNNNKGMNENHIIYFVSPSLFKIVV